MSRDTSKKHLPSGSCRRPVASAAETAFSFMTPNAAPQDDTDREIEAQHTMDHRFLVLPCPRKTAFLCDHSSQADTHGIAHSQLSSTPLFSKLFSCFSFSLFLNVKLQGLFCQMSAQKIQYG